MQNHIIYCLVFLKYKWFKGNNQIYNLIHELFQCSRMLLSKQFYHYAKHGRVDF